MEALFGIITLQDFFFALSLGFMATCFILFWVYCVISITKNFVLQCVATFPIIVIMGITLLFAFRYLALLGLVK